MIFIFYRACYCILRLKNLHTRISCMFTLSSHNNIFNKGLAQNKYMLFAGWEVRIVKNCDRGLENAARGRRPRAAFSSPRSQFFTIRTDPKPANNFFIFFLRYFGLQLGLHNFVIELVYVPSTNHRKKSNERTSE